VPTALVANDLFPGGTESLLIVDDEESLRTLLSAALTRKGYRTASAASGLEAIEMISNLNRPIDLVLLDLNMPGANGVEVLKIIRMCRPQTKVLVISGHITHTARVEFEAILSKNRTGSTTWAADCGPCSTPNYLPIERRRLGRFEPACVAQKRFDFTFAWPEAATAGA